MSRIWSCSVDNGGADSSIPNGCPASKHTGGADWVAIHFHQDRLVKGQEMVAGSLLVAGCRSDSQISNARRFCQRGGIETRGESNLAASGTQLVCEIGAGCVSSFSRRDTSVVP